MKNYEILYKSDDFYLVIIRSIYNVSQIIKNFTNENINNSNFSGIVVFDMLLSSLDWDSNDRFWKFMVKNGKLNFASKEHYNLGKRYIEISNNYFKENTFLLKGALFLRK